MFKRKLTKLGNYVLVNEPMQDMEMWIELRDVAINCGSEYKFIYLCEMVCRAHFRCRQACQTGEAMSWHDF